MATLLPLPYRPEIDGGAKFSNHLNMNGAKYLPRDITAFLLGVVQRPPQRADTKGVPEIRRG